MLSHPAFMPLFRYCPRYIRIFHLICSCFVNHWIPKIAKYIKHIHGLVQERRNSSALAMELRLSCTKTAIYDCIDNCHFQLRPSSSMNGIFLSVCPSVTPFWLCFHHRIIMKFSGVITKDQGKVHAKGQGQRSKVKVTEVTTQLNRFRTVTPVWIHIWWWNDTCSLMLLRRGALLFFKVIRQVSRSHGAKNRRIWPRLGVPGL